MSSKLKLLSVKHLMIVAAGTGGHVFPGLAIAQSLSNEQNQKKAWKISWLGTTQGMEAELVAKAQIPFHAVELQSIRGKGWLRLIKGPLSLLKSFWQSLKILRKQKPDIVFAMGGYLTVPASWAAYVLRIPVFLLNADSHVLLSNKIALPTAKKILFGLVIPDGYVDHEKAVLCGNPVRAQLLNLATPAQRYALHNEAYGQRLRILIVGGSLGAHILNQTLPKALAKIPLEKRPIVTHQSGKQHITQLKAAYQDAGVEAEVLDFIDDMAGYYQAVDLVIGRAGAMTMSELCAVGVASILIPLVVSTTQHQAYNAQWLSEHKASIYLPQNQLNADAMALLLQKLNRDDCSQMAKAAYQLRQAHAIEKISILLEAQLHT